MSRSIFCLTALVLAGCASAPAPPLAVGHPASPQSPEGTPAARASSLSPDAPTRQTRALLSKADAEQARWEAHGPESGPSENSKHESPAEAKP